MSIRCQTRLTLVLSPWPVKGAASPHAPRRGPSQWLARGAVQVEKSRRPLLTMRAPFPPL